MDDRVRAGQVQAGAARLEGEQEHGHVARRLEPVDLGLPRPVAIDPSR
jgi:hypothetical protein